MGSTIGQDDDRQRRILLVINMCAPLAGADGCTARVSTLEPEHSPGLRSEGDRDVTVAVAVALDGRELR